MPFGDARGAKEATSALLGAGEAAPAVGAAEEPASVEGAVAEAIRREVAQMRDAWAAFEQADNPAVEHDFETLESDDPMITSLMTFITVTTFLAGFAVADFGNFSSSEWLTEEGDMDLSGYAFLIIMAFVSGNAMYLSALGCLLAAAYYRSKNQMRDWAFICGAAVRPISKALSEGGGLKGQRKKHYHYAFKEVTRSSSDYINSFNVWQDFKSHADSLHFLSIGRLPDSETWRITFAQPQYVLSLRAFRLLREYTFPVTIVLYVTAQGIKAMRGVHLRSYGAAVPAVLAFWMGRMIFDLRIIYAKLRD